MNHIHAFLTEPAPPSVAVTLARSIEHHVSTCTACAEQLAASASHCAALLHARRFDEPADSRTAPSEILHASRLELLAFANTALERLTPSIRAELTVQPRPSGVSPEVGVPNDEALDRVVLAVSEAALALRSLVLRSDRTLLRRDGSVSTVVDRTRLRNVPARYLDARIGQFAGLTDEAASAVWTAISSVIIDGRVGVSGLAAIDIEADGVVLDVVSEQLPAPSAKVPSAKPQSARR